MNLNAGSVTGDISGHLPYCLHYCSSQQHHQNYKTCLALLSARSSRHHTTSTPVQSCMRRAMLASPTKQYDTPATTSSTPARPSKRLKRSSPDAELNVESVVLGSYLIKPSFLSLYRDEIVGSGAIKRLYVCKGCFKYTKDAAAHIAHRVSSGTLQTESRQILIGTVALL